MSYSHIETAAILVCQKLFSRIEIFSHVKNSFCIAADRVCENDLFNEKGN